MRTSRLTAAAAASLVAVGLAAGCARELEPGLALRSAAETLADAPRASFTVKLSGNVDDLVAAVKLQDEKSGGDTAPDEPSASDLDALKKLFNSSLTAGYDKAGPGAEDDRAFLAATINGIEGTEIRVVDGTVYAKAPVRELATTFGVPAQELEEARAGAEAVSPGMAAAFEGTWVSQKVDELTKLGGAGASPLPTEDVDPAKLTAELQASAEKLLGSAEIDRDAKDRNHLVATTRTKILYEEALRLAKTLQPEALDEIDPADAPADRPVKLDVWVKGGKLTAFELDVIQFIEGAKGRVAVRVEVGTGQEIVAPDGATKLDLSDMLEGMAAPSGPEGARALAEALGMQAASLAEADNVKPTSRHLKQAVKDIPEGMGMDGLKIQVLPRNRANVTLQGRTVCLDLNGPQEGGRVTDGAC